MYNLGIHQYALTSLGKEGQRSISMSITTPSRHSKNVRMCSLAQTGNNAVPATINTYPALLFPVCHGCKQGTTLCLLLSYYPGPLFPVYPRTHTNALRMSKKGCLRSPSGALFFTSVLSARRFGIVSTQSLHRFTTTMPLQYTITRRESQPREQGLGGSL